MPKRPTVPHVTDFSTLSKDAYIRQPDVLRLWPVSSTTLENCVKSGDFPKPTRLSPRAIGWRYGVILDWLNSLETVE